MTKIGIAYREQLTIYDDKLAKSDGSSYFEKRLMYFCAETTELWRRQRERLYVKGSAKILDKPADVPATVELACLLYTSPSPRDLSTSRMPSSA